jgi:hypothetical protein
MTSIKPAGAMPAGNMEFVKLGCGTGCGGWLVWLIWFVLFIELVLFNQINETKQTRQTK